MEQILTDAQRKLLKPYESILTKCTFKGNKTPFIDSQTVNKLIDIYLDITGVMEDCRSCGDKDFIKRMSYWYCGNKHGMLKIASHELIDEKPKQVKKTTRGRKPKSKQ